MIDLFNKKQKHRGNFNIFLGVLKKDGIFVFVSRTNAFMRQANILKPFGFTENETIKILEKCRMFSSVENTIRLCEKYGFVLENQKDFIRDERLTFSVVTMKKNSHF